MRSRTTDICSRGARTTICTTSSSTGTSARTWTACSALKSHQKSSRKRGLHRWRHHELKRDKELERDKQARMHMQTTALHEAAMNERMAVHLLDFIASPVLRLHCLVASWRETRKKCEQQNQRQRPFFLPLCDAHAMVTIGHADMQLPVQQLNGGTGRSRFKRMSNE